MKRWPSVIAIVMLLSTWGFLESLSHGEPVLARKSFSEFPVQIADKWAGKEVGLEQSVLDVLKLSDYMMRYYAPTPSPMAEIPAKKQEAAPVWLYVGFYESQRTGATYHSPKNCLPGSGWQFIESVPDTITLGGQTITINRVLIQKGLEKEVILYWYHDRGRVIASEYWAKIYLVWDAMNMNRTDGSLVRISVPVTTDVDAAYRQARAFLEDFWPLLLDYMPSAPT
jgi:EpsI family protein